MQQVATTIAALIAGLLLATQLTGCSPGAVDPYARAGTWHATGVNDANLRAMVADPDDLALGRSTDSELAVEAVPPVGRLLSGRRAPLSNDSASGIGSSAPTAPTPQGPANAGQ